MSSAALEEPDEKALDRQGRCQEKKSGYVISGFAQQTHPAMPVSFGRRELSYMTAQQS
ncbi:hypothetical protein Baya_12012 [Bagarius yarrelli]|uniref:Uncharacterized protein n=1 Tax=Bagarius yarrelli TaxID=175774 RepID=A0A556V268_BAGYA|nr:hypothetical protein Baya_12012 [Bagarius yarrelli]